MVSERLIRRSHRLALDTNGFIYFFSGLEPYLSILLPLFRRVQMGELSLIVSAVTEAEMLVRPYRDEDAGAIERIRDLLSENGIEVVPVDRRIARRTAIVRARSGLKLADAIIVATAIETGCEAVVTNDGEWTKRSLDVPVVLLDDVVPKN